MNSFTVMEQPSWWMTRGTKRSLTVSDGWASVRCRLTCITALDGLFSGEEMLGRYLDLYVSHAQYFNILKGSVGCVHLLVS